MKQAENQHWNDYYDQRKDFRLISSQTIDRFLAFYHQDAPKTALDIGCGTGQLTRELWHRGYKVAGIDIAANAIKIARSLTIVPDSELCYKQGDIEQSDQATIPFQPYGLITCKFAYAFIQDKLALLERVAQLLAPQGIFVVITPLIEMTSPEKQGIAVNQEAIDILRDRFVQRAWYEEYALGFFVGEKRVS